MRPHEPNILYEIVSTHRDQGGDHVIVSRMVDTVGKVFAMTAKELTLHRKDVLSGFSVDDVVSIIGVASMQHEPIMHSRSTTDYRYFTLIALLFCASLMIANITSAKLFSLLGSPVGAGFMAYGCTYSLSNIITEVYGYKRMRQVIWYVALVNCILIGYLYLTTVLVPTTDWQYQDIYIQLIGHFVPRIILGSILGYSVGEFINSYIISRMKLLYDGQYLMLRILYSSFSGILLDTLIFVTIGYSGVFNRNELIHYIISLVLFKLLLEFLLTPVEVILIKKIKAKERVDIYDHNTRFTPFSLDIEYSERDNRFQD